jgi:hypothetical protein
MAIGGLWIPREDKLRFTKDVQSVRRLTETRGEVKWSKASDRCLGAYNALVDIFFAESTARFRVIVVDQNKVDVDKHHGGDRELGFYKFYYEMLEKWIEPGNEYLILLDFKQNCGADRYKSLRRVLERKIRGRAWISDLTVIDSREAPIGQVCDLLTGAVAASCCADLREGSAKAKLAAHIAQKAGLASLRISSPSPTISKFNIFRIQLQ